MISIALHVHETHLSRALGETSGIGVLIGVILLLLAIGGGGGKGK